MDDPTTDEPMEPDLSARERAEKLVGQVVSQRYRMDALLAMGGMGAVYKGHHLLLKKRVAIKVLHPEIENLPELVARFEREAIAGAHISHPNVAAATDFGQLDDGSYFLVLEYVPGRTLHKLIREGRLSPVRATRIARQIASALSAAHSIGVVHRDVKPRNVMIDENKGDHAKLIDFGLAKVPVDRVVAHASVRPPAASLPDGRPRLKLDSLVDSKPRLTGVGMIVGTIAYLAPEAALGMEAVDARADLYALGLVLYEMLAGVHPFDAQEEAALFAAQRFQRPPAFTTRAPDVEVPHALEALVMKLLEKDPAARHQTADEVIAALDAAEPRDEPTAAPASRTAVEVEAPARSRYLPVLVGAIAVAVGVTGVLALRGKGGEHATPASEASARATASVHAAAPSATVDPPRPHPNPGPVVTAKTAAAASAASAAVETAALPEGDVPALRNLLLRALRVRDWGGGEAAFLALVAKDPAVFHTPDMMTAARDLAVALDREGRGDRMFEVLTSRLGTDGLDVLYDLVATKGRASAAVRAEGLLSKEDILARASPEVRIAFALRMAPCVDKLGLLDRAVKEGDERALVVMQTQGVACFRKNNRAVRDAMAALRTRLNRGQ